MTEYEKELLVILEESFSNDEYNYFFDVPENPEETEKLLSALRSLEDACKIIILATPEDTDIDYIEVEMFPPCCGPSLKI